MGKYFGTDGMRGRFGTELTLEHALKIGEFLGFYYATKDVEGIAVGMDTRESSPFLKTAITLGMNSYGVDVYDLDVIPTPGVSYLCKTFHMPGVVISASHNPYWDNGIKLFNEYGEKMEESVISAVEAVLDTKDFFAPEHKAGAIIPFTYGKEAYVKFLRSQMKDYSGLKIAMDLANGAASQIAKEVFKGMDVTFIHHEPDGKNINNGCGSVRMGTISDFVKNGNYDIGFALDGDADRCLFTDEDGSIKTGDDTIYITAKSLKEKNSLPGNLVALTIMSNYGLVKALEAESIYTIRTDVGDKYVYEALKENRIFIGGEASGHTIFRNLENSGDGMLTAIQILNIMSETKKSVTELTKGYVPYPQVLVNVSVTDKNAVMGDKKIAALVDELKDSLKGKGILVVRASGTESKIRIMSMADDESTAQETVDKVQQRIAELGYKI